MRDSDIAMNGSGELADSIRRGCVRVGSIFVIAFASVKLIHLSKSWLRKHLAAEEAGKLQEQLPLEALGKMCRYGTVPLQKSAAQVLLDRAMQQNHVEYFVSYCEALDDDTTVTLEAVTALSLLAKSKKSEDVLLRCGTIQALVRCLQLKCALNDQTRTWIIQRAALIGLFDLTLHSEWAKQEAMSFDMVAVATRLLDTSRSRDVQYWSLALLRSFIMEDSISKSLRQNDSIARALAKSITKASGNVTVQKMAVQALVLLSSGDSDCSYKLLCAAAEEKFVSCTIAALNSDEHELVYWALGLLHELTVKQVNIEQIKSTPQLISNLFNALSATDASAQKIVLRILGFLAIKDDLFKKSLIDIGFPERLGICIGSGDVEVAHWAIVIVHDLAMLGVDACERILESGTCIPAMVQISKKAESLGRLSAETFGLICASESLHLCAVECGVLKGLAYFASSDNSDIQLWATFLLLKMVQTSIYVRAAVIQSNCVEELMNLALCAKHDDIPEMCAKAISTLVLEDEEFGQSVKKRLLEPLLQRIRKERFSPFILGKSMSVLEVLLRNRDHRKFALEFEDKMLLKIVVESVEKYVELSPWSVQLVKDNLDKFHDTGSLCLASCRLLSYWAADAETCTLLAKTECFKRISSVLGVTMMPLFALKGLIADVRMRYDRCKTNAMNTTDDSSQVLEQLTQENTMESEDIDLLECIHSTPCSEVASMVPEPRLIVTSPRVDRVLDFETEPSNESRPTLAKPPSPKPKQCSVPILSRQAARPTRAVRLDSARKRRNRAVAASVNTPTSINLPTFSPRETLDRANVAGDHPHVFSPRTNFFNRVGSPQGMQNGTAAQHTGALLSVASGFIAQPLPSPIDLVGELHTQQVVSSPHPEGQSNGTGSQQSPLFSSPVQNLRSPVGNTPSHQIRFINDITRRMKNRVARRDRSRTWHGPRTASVRSAPLDGTHSNTATHGVVNRSLQFGKVRHKSKSYNERSTMKYHSRGTREGTRALDDCLNSRPDSSSASNVPESNRTINFSFDLPRIEDNSPESSPVSSLRHASDLELHHDSSHIASRGHVASSVTPQLQTSYLSQENASYTHSAVGTLDRLGIYENLSDSESNTTCGSDGASTTPDQKTLATVIVHDDSQDSETISESDMIETPRVIRQQARWSELSQQRPVTDVFDASAIAPKNWLSKPSQTVEVVPALAVTDTPVQEYVPSASQRQKDECLSEIGFLTMLEKEWDERDDQEMEPLDASIKLPHSPEIAQLKGSLKHRMMIIKDIKEVADHISIVLTLASYASMKNTDIQEELLTSCSCHMWAMMFACCSPRINFLTSAFMGVISGEHVQRLSPAAELSPTLSTPNVMIGPDMRTALNGSWTFESVVGNSSAIPGGVSYYEAKVLTSGIIQVGWASRSAKFSPEFGQGVGDSPLSFAFDGCRGCLWTGVGDIVVEGDGNARRWFVNDVVGCYLDMELGEARFELNGDDLGAVIRIPDVDEEWLPAISLANGQQIEVNFGAQEFWLKPPLEHNALLPKPSTKGIENLESQRVGRPTLSSGESLGRNSILLPDIVCYFEVTGIAPLSWVGFKTPSLESETCWAGIVSSDCIFKACENDQGCAVSQISVIGCGIIVQGNTPKMFFTVDGSRAEFTVRVPTSAVLPYFSCQVMHANYGQREFLYTEADKPDTRERIGQNYLHWANSVGPAYWGGDPSAIIP